MIETPYPETVWLAQRWYERHDGYEHVEQIIVHRDLVPGLIAYGYEVAQYVRTAAQPFRRRPLTEAEAVAAREWSPPTNPREAGLFCDGCHTEGRVEHCTGYYFDPATGAEGIG